MDWDYVKYHAPQSKGPCIVWANISSTYVQSVDFSFLIKLETAGCLIHWIPKVKFIVTRVYLLGALRL